MPVLLCTGYRSSAQDAIRQGFVVLHKPFDLAAVCAENRVRIDLMTESPNVIGDDRAAILLTGVIHLAIQIEEPA